MKSDCKPEPHDFCGVPAEPMANPELEAAGIRIFRPSPPKKAPDDKLEDHEN
jgi:hypothetical protein